LNYGATLKIDITLWAIVAITQILVGFLGLLAIKSDFAAQHFKTFVAAFIVLSVLGMVASGVGVMRATMASAKIEQLSEQTLIAIQGSPDGYLEIYPVFETDNYEKGIANFQFTNSSEYPMIDTYVWQSGGRHLNVVPEKYGRLLGDVYAGNGGKLPGLIANLSKEKTNMVNFAIQSRSGSLWQETVFKWNGKAWVIDSCVYSTNEKNEKRIYKPYREKTNKIMGT
jgi:hypothetical protein